MAQARFLLWSPVGFWQMTYDFSIVVCGTNYVRLVGATLLLSSNAPQCLSGVKAVEFNAKIGAVVTAQCHSAACRLF